MAEEIRRVPPSSLEAEQSILGSALLSEGCALAAVERLKERDFYMEAHRRIFGAVMDLVVVGKPVDLVTVIERLEQGRALSAEELTYLTDLTQRVPSTKNIDSYIDIVREKSQLRQLLEVCGGIADTVYAGKASASEALNEASDRIYKITDERSERTLTHIRQALVESYEMISKAARSKDGLMGVATGFPIMDKTLSGLQPTQLIVVAGRPGMGKTSFALNIAEHVAIKEKRPVVIFSLEMSADQLAMRLLCAGAQVDSQNARVGMLSEKDFYSLADAMVPLEESPIYIDDNSLSGPTDMLAKVRRLRQQIGDIGLIVIDYLQLMGGDGDNRGDNRQQEISKITRSLKIMAKEMQVPVMLLSQLSRASEKRENKRPMLSDLRESGAIEQDADVVIFLHREDYYSDDEND
ncbi:MAG: replicative DNA helicase, partial [Christensenellaceae bacterium]|nr:replicative DNA helicase [Christensenellaceae bacterium]